MLQNIQVLEGQKFAKYFNHAKHARHKLIKSYWRLIKKEIKQGDVTIPKANLRHTYV